MYVTCCGPYGWQVLRIDGTHGVLVAGAVDQPHAERIAALLSQHGMVDVPLDQVQP